MRSNFSTKVELLALTDIYICINNYNYKYEHRLLILMYQVQLTILFDLFDKVCKIYVKIN